MKDYDLLDVEQLSQDSYFRNWVFGKTDEGDTFWEHWQAGNPVRRQLVAQARLLVLSMTAETSNIFTDQEILDGKNRILAEISVSSQKRSVFNFMWLRLAASVVIMLGIGWWLLDSRTVSQVKDIGLGLNTQTTVLNEESGPKTITLPDGSRVTLATQSELRYGRNFGDSIRYVYLVGGAFFQVVKNPQKPFVVNTRQLVTKVLGTSFHVAAYEKDSETRVSVVTGKVTVSRQPAASDAATTSSAEIVLVPNQKAVFNQQDQQLVKTLVENPQPVSARVQEQDFVFQETNLKQVYQMLEKYYGVQITFDQQVFAHCSVTADLRQESLYKKLDLICEIIQAQYKIADGQILISGAGCQKQQSPF
ncbi:FecR family protein [Dyadobacter alkalitolerans]|uniref:FecR family protein n=1 Tax=Dyadobacter alkalitolerans TaxID=492736 RepID=UPI00041AAAEA|nr:FecR family protein [Dyadobacter alkalitolerans]